MKNKYLKPDAEIIELMIMNPVMASQIDPSIEIGDGDGEQEY